MDRILVILKTLALSLLGVFAPVQGVMGAALGFTVLDFFTGVFAAKRRGEKINSSDLKRTPIKLLVYELAIAIGFLAQHFLTQDSLPVVNIASTFVAITELTSVYENISTISGSDVLKTIIDKLHGQQ